MAKKLTLFNNAYYHDEQEGNRKKVIIKDGKYHQYYIRIRLQGIDSPELHYKASQRDQFLYDNQLSKFKCLNDVFEFRQHFGARAAKELVELLKGYAKEENKRKFLYAYTFSLIDIPSNLFDRFGRAVADVVVFSHNKTYDISDDNKNAQENTDDINLNQWLVEEGWVFPDYYDSMSNEEILSLQEKSKIASNTKRS
jgi:endonuclease YncB( thermonuclease family)